MTNDTKSLEEQITHQKKHNEKKLQKYKKYIHALKADLKTLEKSNEVS